MYLEFRAERSPMTRTYPMAKALTIKALLDSIVDRQ